MGNHVEVFELACGFTQNSLLAAGLARITVRKIEGVWFESFVLRIRHSKSSRLHSRVSGIFIQELK